jgi:protein-L-isoaspartate(D-aspartate) O-methyltransferase
VVRDDRVEQALRDVPRAPFLPAALRDRAALDAPLPIGHGQTNSQPYTVAFMLSLLAVRPGDRVLDLGAGSGWTTALLAALVGESGTVLGVERVQDLIGPARRALADAREGATAPFGSAEIRPAQPGVLGAPEDGPFDRVLVSAEARTIPGELVDQLVDGGIMVLPVGTTMCRVVRRGERREVTEHGSFRFVPLIVDDAPPPP